MVSATRRNFLGAVTVMGGAAVATTALQSPAEATADCPPTPDAASIGPDDPRYQELLVRGYNARYLGGPETYHVVYSARHIVKIVNDALRAGKRIVVRSGGHCFENFVDDPSAQVVIDLSEMNEVYYDHRHRAFAIEAGANLGKVYRSLYLGWGVTIPAGGCPSVGVGGHIAGGGYGPLSRQHGLVVDHLYGVEVVLVDRSGRARTVVATRDSKGWLHDLWWAHTGGGGGNFGIVTRYLMRSPQAERHAEPAAQLPKPPAELLVCQLHWNWADLDEAAFTRLADNYGRWHQGPGKDPAYASMDTALTMFHRSSGRIDLTASMDAGVPRAQDLMGQLIYELSQGVAEPAIEFFGTGPWMRLSTAYQEASGGYFIRFKSKSAYHPEPWSAAQTATVFKYLTQDAEYHGGAVYLLAYGGRINSVAPDATALPHRSSTMIAFYDVGWYDPAEDDRWLDWVRALYRDVYAESGGVPPHGAYINYPDLDLADPAHNTSGTAWHTLYYKDNYPRLQRVKAQADPLDVFSHGLSVRAQGAERRAAAQAPAPGKGRVPQPAPKAYAKAAPPSHVHGYRILDVQ
ncbi:FAD-binding protein [Nonomuraea antri]|uniref:FAD-binding protein n=1 Tax=Nonomuraea antri TaxID=2730852 RepID=UPI001C2C5D84|nr:FAD-binding protein [Nonomuraea antri]